MADDLRKFTEFLRDGTVVKGTTDRVHVDGGYLVPTVTYTERAGLVGWFLRLIKHPNGWDVHYPYRELMAAIESAKVKRG